MAMPEADWAASAKSELADLEEIWETLAVNRAIEQPRQARPCACQSRSTSHSAPGH
jgi:hypothetical protein